MESILHSFQFMLWVWRTPSPVVRFYYKFPGFSHAHREIGPILGSSHLDLSHFSCSIEDLVEDSYISPAFSSLNLSFITMIIVWYPSNWKSNNGKGEWGLTPGQGGSEASLTDDNGLQHLYLDILDRTEVQCLQLKTLTYHVVASYWLDPSFSDHPSLSHENSKT